MSSAMSAAQKPIDPGFSDFFTASVRESDPEVYASLRGELLRQQNQIELIPSENIVSKAVLEAQGSVLTNKYAEGYPGKRYYGGNDQVDIAESVAIERAKKMFGCAFANVQPNSGSQANQAVFLALLQPGDTFMGLSLKEGGHLTHGSPVNVSGKWFKAVSYTVREDNHRIDYEGMERLALEHRPKIIIAGGSAYPRVFDFARMRAICDKIGAYLMADIAHFAGLVVGGVYPNPFPHAHVVTTTTHKTLRGPRGGMILANDPDLGKKFNSAVFPGMQGGPLMHVIAAKAVAFGEALRPEFKAYSQAVLDNNRAMAAALTKRGCALVSGGTDSNLILVDLRPMGLVGSLAETSLDHAGITCNKNGIPFDPLPPAKTSGIRIGSPAITTRGFSVAECAKVGELIADVLEGLQKNADDNRAAEQRVRQEVTALCRRFPIYGELMKTLEK